LWVRIGAVDLTTYRGQVTLRSAGPRSDTLLQAIDRLYATNLGVTAMAPQVKFSGISLGGNPTALDEGPTRIKLFFESDADDRYAEIFLDLDIQEGTIRLNEKDPDYRKAVVQALAGQ